MKTSAAFALLLFLLTLSAFAQTDKTSTDPDTRTSEGSVQSAVPPDSTRLILTGKVEPDVVSAEPVSGNPILTQAAVAAMKQWKFQPYIHDGHPVQIGYKMPYDFAIGDRVHDNPMATGDTALTSALPISSGELQKYLLHQIAPVYPDIARQRMIQGTVVLKAVIGKDGNIKDLTAVSGPKELYESAIGAVQQWRYKPVTLDGKPVEVESTINVNYKLSH